MVRGNPFGDRWQPWLLGRVAGTALTVTTLLMAIEGGLFGQEPSPPQPFATNQPPILRDPSLDRTQEDFVPQPDLLVDQWFMPPLLWPVDPPTGYTGPSSVAPREIQESSHFVPMEDRWRIGFPEWDRYDRNHPPLDEYPYVPGRIQDPYHQ